MRQTHKLKNKTKKKIIIISVCIVAMLAVIAVLILAFLFFQEQNTELNQNTQNVLYYNEEELEEENNELVVELENVEEPKKENIDNSTNQETTNVNTTYYIKVNNQANVVTIYKKDQSGEYTIPVKAMLCSVGTATPSSGVYSISDKYTWRLLQGNVYGQYACRITGHILFHSVPYASKDKSTLEWWEYDKLGTKASLGCIRLTVGDAKWIYDNCIAGTKVEFYSSSNAGPLGTPTSKKISKYEDLRNWDPTDPDSNNPWNNYSEDQETDETSTNVDKKEISNTNTTHVENTTITTTNTITNTNENNIITNMTNTTNTIINNIINTINNINTTNVLNETNTIN